MTERERLIELLKKAPYGANAITLSDKHKDSILGEIADYLLENGVHITACATCEYIKHLKDEGRIIELMGKPIKYCPECGEELR